MTDGMGTLESPQPHLAPPGPLSRPPPHAWLPSPLCVTSRHCHFGTPPLHVTSLIPCDIAPRAILPSVRHHAHPALGLMSWTAKAVFHHSHKHKKQDALQPCDTEYPVFVHQTAIQEANGIIECGACRKIFVMQQIPSSNLLLLVTDPTCDCSIFPPVLQEATEVKYNASIKCDRLRSQKLRRRPDTCHAFHPEENAQECGGSSDTSASLPLLLLPLCAWGLSPQLLR